MISVLAAVLFTQISTPAIVARVKERETKVQDLHALVRMEIFRQDEVSSRVFELWLKRDGVDYRALLVMREPDSMRGTKFLVHAARGERNEQWAYFPDLDLTRSIPGRSQDDPFLGSDVTYADLAGGAHLDDLRHRLVGEERVDGDLCYVLEGVPRREIAYGKLRGWVRKDDFVTVKARFFDAEGEPNKEAHLRDVRDLGNGVLFAHRVEVEGSPEEARTVLSFENVSVNRGISDERFLEENLARD